MKINFAIGILMQMFSRKVNIAFGCHAFICHDLYVVDLKEINRLQPNFIDK
ncbi:MAG: hypothetical protein M3139_15790 [Bacteroidota bacterium]|nr:hypothetical protein [Bacteroidota bacterium]